MIASQAVLLSLHAQWKAWKERVSTTSHRPDLPPQARLGSLDACFWMEMPGVGGVIRVVALDVVGVGPR